MAKISAYTAVLAAAMVLLSWPPVVFSEQNTSPATESKVKSDAGEETAEESLSYIPLLQYESLALRSRRLRSPGAGFVIMREGFIMTGFYSRHAFEEEPAYRDAADTNEVSLLEYPGSYHSIDVMIDGKHGKNERGNYLFLFSSSSNEPAAGGLETLQMAGVYGRKLVDGQRGFLTLGGGLAVSDFGIETPGGGVWPVIPVPLIRAAYEGTYLSATFDFITGPNLSMTILPDRPFRMKGDLRMDEYRDLRDLIFEILLTYKPGFAGISAGFKNDAYAFDLAEGEEKYEMHYHALFGVIDLSILKISVGYAFDARERYREEYTQQPDNGLYASIEGMYKF